MNGVWLEIDFDDPTQESAAAKHIFGLLRARYTPLVNAPIKTHC